MGLTRKFLSVSSLGLISFRSRDERMEKFAKQTRNATRAAVAQRATGLELPRDQLAQAEVHHVDNRTDRGHLRDADSAAALRPGPVRRPARLVRRWSRRLPVVRRPHPGPGTPTRPHPRSLGASLRVTPLVRRVWSDPLRGSYVSQRVS